MSDSPQDDANKGPLTSVAPTAAMGRDPVARGLSVGATGSGKNRQTYRILAPLDRGGMGELFLAEATSDGTGCKLVVLKRLLTDLIDDEKYVSMFLTEAQVMARLDHPNIVRVYDLPVIEGTQCLAMEYVRGRNVHQILQRAGELHLKMPLGVALRITRAVLSGLDYAHNLTVEDGTPLHLVHRDVTPGNVLVSYGGEVKLTDFGIAKSMMSAVTTTVGIVKGKARYLSPEQILGEPATPRSDVFSCATLLIEMLTGKPLFEHGTIPKTLYAIVHAKRPSAEERLGFRAPLLSQLIERALAVDPKARLGSAQEFRIGIEAAVRAFSANDPPSVIGDFVSEIFRDVEDPLTEYETSSRAPHLPSNDEIKARAPLVLQDAKHSTEAAEAHPVTGLVSGFEPVVALERAPTISTAPPKPQDPTVFDATGVDHAAIRSPPRVGQEAASAPKRAPRALRKRFTRAMPAFFLGVIAGIVGTIQFERLFVKPSQQQPAAVQTLPPRVQPSFVDMVSMSADTKGSEEFTNTSTKTTAQAFQASSLKPSREVSERSNRSLQTEELGQHTGPQHGTLDILQPKGGRVWINGELLKSKVPVRKISLAPGKHKIQIQRGKFRKETTVVIEPGEEVQIGKKPPLPKKSAPER